MTTITETKVTATATRETILNLLSDWINQRPGLEWANYASGDWRESRRSYWAEYRSILRDKRDAHILLSAVARSSITQPELTEAFSHAFSGRLTLTTNTEGEPCLEYCTGQYWPTEYRKAACAVLAQALWYHIRGSIPSEGRGNKSPGDLIRDHFKREFGSRMQRRWFD